MKICGNNISTKFSLPEVTCNYGILRSRVIIYISACAIFPDVVFAAISNIGLQEELCKCSIHVVLLLKNSQNSRRNTFAVDFFLIKKQTPAQIFSCEFSAIFKKTFLQVHIRATIPESFLKIIFDRIHS